VYDARLRDLYSSLLHTRVTVDYLTRAVRDIRTHYGRDVTPVDRSFRLFFRRPFVPFASRTTDTTDRYVCVHAQTHTRARRRCFLRARRYVLHTRARLCIYTSGRRVNAFFITLRARRRGVSRLFSRNVIAENRIKIRFTRCKQRPRSRCPYVFRVLRKP